MRVFPIIKCAGVSCNIRCDYCFYRNMGQDAVPDKVMGEKVLEELIKQLFEVNPGVCNFLWHGGEPLLAGRKFFELVLKLQGKHKTDSSKIVNSIQTNGVLLNKDWAGFFKVSNFRIGVSIDGPEHVHNRYRKKVNGAGSFKDTKRGIEYCQEAGLDIGAIVAVTSYSAQFPVEIYRFLVNNGIKKIAFNPVFEVNSQGRVCDFSASDSAFSAFLEKILCIWLEEDDPTVEIRQFIDPMRSMLGGNISTCIYSGLCEQFLDIYPNGNVKSCHSRNDEAGILGNFLSERLVDILRGERYRQLSSSVKKLPSSCSSCRWFSACHGGCPDYRDLSVDGTIGDEYLYCGSRKTIFNILEKRLLENK